MAIATATATLIAAGISAAATAGSAVSSAQRGKKARKAQRAQQAQIASLEANRQEIIDPTANIKDLSSMITNPFANLQVATGAAEFQAEQSDLSLASTLDTLRATGAGAGGATALAQAALRSKQDIAANIQRQEAQNARMRAQGEQRANQLRLQEATRVQAARASGQEFMFRTQEQRDMQQLNRAAGQLAQFQSQEQAARAQTTGAIASFAGTALQAGSAIDQMNQSPTTGGGDFKNTFSEMAKYNTTL